MLVVKPNPRRMRYMRDSPSERFGELHRPGLWQRLRWERVALALGLAYGFVQHFFLNWRYSAGLLGLAISIEILLAAASVETSITKMVGGLVASSIAAWLVARFAMPGLLPWLTGRRRPSS